MSTEEIARINEASKRYYDSADLGYWLNTPFSDPYAHRILWRFGLLLSGIRPLPCHRILDFGCGPGWASVMLAQMGYEVVGMDIAPAALDIANRRADQTLNPAQRERCAFAAYSGSEIPFPDGHFDVVLILEALHHLPNPKTLFREWHRVLGTQGRLGFAEPGVGHTDAEISVHAKDQGILEQDLELQQVHNTAMTAGFSGLELLIPPVEPQHLALPMSRARWFLRGLSWLVPANFVRHALVTGPIGILRKGAYADNSLFPGSHRAQISTSTGALNLTRSQPFKLSARIENPSETVWLRQGNHGVGFVRLGASLLDEQKQLLIRDFGRADLPADVKPGCAADLQIELTAPPNPGSFHVRLDAVNEGIAWFGDKGSATMDVKLEVT